MSQGLAALPDLAGLSGWASEIAAVIAVLAGDIALVVGADGLVRHVALGEALGRDAVTADPALWLGHPLAEAVTHDTRHKVALLLAEAGAQGVARPREVNLPPGDRPGRDVPLSLAAVRLGAQGPLLAVGRDLRAVSALQQRFLAAQQALEHDHWQQRQAEARYRLLFQVATDAVLVVDAAQYTVVEANLAASRLFGQSPQALVGRSVLQGLAVSSQAPVAQRLAQVRAGGKPVELCAWLAGAPDDARAPLVDLAIALLTPGDAPAGAGTPPLLLLRARSREARADPSTRRLADFVALMPEGLAIVDGRGCVLLANPALVQMCRHGGDELSLVGRRLPDLLGDPQQRLDGLLEDARRQGSISGVPATLGSTGQPLAVEVSAARLAHGGPDSVGLIVHRRAALARPLPDAAADADGGHDGLDSLVAQLGRVSLPELVQEATHLAERRLIRAAMHRAPGDLAAAADWLGIAPDSLRLRLQRHGLPLGQAADGGPSTLLN
jgi:transcriptional regulator PpsR